uniref:Cyclin dependent kinase 20 n=1 Tax=Canis lupus familiaris TaxID=9615 RepID=A0A8C0RB63_CANLF
MGGTCLSGGSTAGWAVLRLAGWKCGGVGGAWASGAEVRWDGRGLGERSGSAAGWAGSVSRTEVRWDRRGSGERGGSAAGWAGLGGWRKRGGLGGAWPSEAGCRRAGGAWPGGAAAREGVAGKAGRPGRWSRSLGSTSCCTFSPFWRPGTCSALPRWTRSGMRFQGPKNCGGGIDELAYISTNECRFDGQEKSVVCTVSSDSTVRAWDVQEGTEIWSSPLQPAALVNLAAYPRLQLVVTVDKQGLIKTWKAENGREWASFSLPTSSSALQACDHPETPFLLVASAEGVMYTLTVPQLQLLSWTSVFPSSPTSLLCSPDSQWVFASTQDSDLGPKVFYTQSLRCVVEDEPPVSSTLPVLLTSRACWAPDETARLMVMHRNSDNMRLAITTYELGTKQSQKVQQIASFLLPDNMMPPHLMKGHGSQVVLLVSGLELVLFTIQGLQLAAFQDHQKPITSMWVDQSRVLTASFDLSLRVYVWNKENKFPVLKSCYHLLGGSHRWASGFTHVESDSMSIVGIEARSIGTSILRSYCFNVQHGSDDCVD